MLLCGQISMWSSTAPAAALTDSTDRHLTALTRWRLGPGVGEQHGDQHRDT